MSFSNFTIKIVKKGKEECYGSIKGGAFNESLW